VCTHVFRFGEGVSVEQGVKNRSRVSKSGSIKANGSATQTNKFVYEYDWDGTNGENESVASGVYLYRFKIDDSIVKTGKLVLIR